jgi:hypothetical protein
MSFWDEFLDNVIKPVGNIAPSLAKSFVGGAAVAGTQIASSTVIPKGLPAQTQKDAARSLQDASRAGIQKNLGYDTKKDTPNADPLLYTADALVQNLLSPYITRPAATATLLSDTSSPLYKAKEYEKGFQLSDIQDAYKRSEKVSFYQALTKSADTSIIGSFSSAIMATGGIDLDQINLFNDEDVKKAYSDNVVGRWYTGIGDFVAGNFLISGGIKATGNIGKWFGSKAGLNMAKQTVENFAQDINNGLIHIASMGKEGKASNAAIQIDALAKSDDINFVVGQVRKYSFNDQLPDLILKTKDSSQVADLILADKGYIPALERLSTTNPDGLWKMTDVNSHLQELYLRTGKVIQPDAKAMERINAAMDASIAKNPVHQQIKDAFLDSAGNRKVLGKDNYFPVEPIVGAETVGNAVVKAGKIGARVKTRDLSTTGTFSETIIGDGAKGALTSLLRLTTARKPIGMVSVSGERPWDAVDEINAFFDDIKLFQNGENIIKTSTSAEITTAEYRTVLIKAVMEQPTSVGKEEVLKSFNKTFGRDLARTYGFNDMNQVDKFIEGVQSQVSSMHSAIAQKGFAMDASGRRIITDAWTTRQFADSYRLVPFNVIEKEILKSASKSGRAGMITTAEQSKGLFEILNKYWTFDVLGRPSYIPKNSIFEPALSGVLAQGVSYITDNAYNATKNGLFNNANRAKAVANKIYNAKDAIVVNRTIDTLHNKLNSAYGLLDELSAEYAAFIDGTVSPVTRVEYIGRVESDLKKAQKLVENTEIELGSALRPLGFKVPSIPSIANLEARVKYLETTKFDKTKSATLGAVIANAKAAIGQAKGSIYTMVTDSTQVSAKNLEIEKQYVEIEKIIASLGEANVEQANVFGKSVAYKARRYGKEAPTHAVINGQYISVDSLFDPNQFGQAYRATLSNSLTTQVNFLGEAKMGVKQGMLNRRASQQVTDINSPKYFEELAHVANRFVRKDLLIDEILAGKNEQELIQWAIKNKSYLKSFNVELESEIPGFIKHKVNLVNRYFPDETAKALILKQEVSSVDLQKILAPKMGQLHPIHPNDFDQLRGTQVNINGLAALDERLSQAYGAVWKKLTAPENALRWAYAEPYFAETVVRKAKVIAQKGINLSVDEINALRQAAARETISETEKVFYTVRRPNRGLFAARAAMGFPTASANAMYRYGRFAGKNPSRIGGFLNSYQGLYNSFGVDKYGNPVDDPSKAVSIVLPGTVDMKFLGGPVSISAKSVGFLLNAPTPSVWVTIGLGTILKLKPKVEDTVKQIIGEKNYEIFFPYGVKSNVGETFTPTWLQDLITGLKGDVGDKKFADSVISNWDMAMTLFEMDKGPKPIFEKVVKAAQKSYLKKAGWGFASPLGAPIKVDLKPNGIIEDYYNILMNKYKQQKKLNTLDAEKYAEKEMLANIPKLPIDRVKFRGSDKNAYIAPTQESYSRIWEQHSKLAAKLASVDPSTVAYLTADIESDPSKFSTSIYSFLNNPKSQLPGGFPINKLPLSPERLEVQLQKNRSWTKYITFRDALTADVIAKGGKSLRQVPAYQEALKNYANTELKSENQAWWVEWKQNAGVKNNAFTQVEALYYIVNDKKFMDQHGKSKFWEDTDVFLKSREEFAKTYSTIQNSTQKSAYRENYLTAVEESLGTFHPRLQEIIKRYLDDDNLTMVG